MSRAMLAERSALLRWSAASTWILRPSTSPPKSSTAILAAVSLPGPVMSAYRLDMSRMPPIFSGGLSWACTTLALSASAAAKMPDKTCFMEKISLIAPYSDGGLVIALGYRSWLKLLPQSCRMHKSAASGGALDDLIGAHVFRKAEWR